MIKWLYSNPKSEQTNREEVSVEYINLVDKKKKCEIQAWKIESKTGEVGSTTDSFNLLQLLD